LCRLGLLPIGHEKLRAKPLSDSDVYRVSGATSSPPATCACRDRSPQCQTAHSPRLTSHAADAFRHLAMALEQSAVRSAFHRRLEHPRLGIV
jgi:hypothetical protein